MRRRPALLLLPLIAACELTEVTVPMGDPRVVVHAVLSRGAGTQFVIVEEALVGQSPEPIISSPLEPPPELPQHPIDDAVVALSYAPGSRCAGTVDVLPPAQTPGMYRRNGLCTPDPGDVVSLRVETADGRVVTGATTMPGARDVSVGYGGVASAASGASFNRDHDTLRVAVEPVLARAMQLEVRRSDRAGSLFPSAQEPLVFYALFDTLRISLPGDLINPFEGDSGEVIFRAGVAYDVTVAVTDTNYYDFARSFSDPLTGRGFINHLEGGLGVFGAVEPHTHRLRAVADVDDPREGVYRLRGDLGGRSVDVTLELYVDEAYTSLFAAFIEGLWYGRVINRSVDGILGPGADQLEHFEAGLEFPADTAQRELWILNWVRPALGQGFRVDVRGLTERGETIAAGVLDGVQLSGPTPVSRTDSSAVRPARTFPRPSFR